MFTRRRYDMPRKAIDYEDAVRWIAENDAPADEDDLETLAGYLTVVMVADLFDTEDCEVAADVLADREFRRPL